MSYDVTVKTTLEVGSECIEIFGQQTRTGVTKRSDQEFKVKLDTAVLWDAAAPGAQTDFQLLLLVSDQPVELELTIGKGLANDELISATLAKGVPFVLGSDDAFSNHAPDDVFAGTPAKINHIRAKETNDVEATVRRTLFA